MRAIRFATSDYGVVLLAKAATLLPCREEADFMAAADIAGAVTPHKLVALEALRNFEQTSLGSDPLNSPAKFYCPDEYTVLLSPATRDWFLRRVTELAEPGWVAEERLRLLTNMRTAPSIDV